MARFGEVLHGGPVTAEEVDRVRQTVVFEPPELSTKLFRFWCLLTLSAAIAGFGLIADSVATVIGAMIVAPLMLPIVGLAFGVSIGDRRAIVNSLAVGAGGIATAVLVGWLISFVLPPSFDPEPIGQIITRTSPRLIDLLAALATGLTGAFAVGRRDVADTLPGVAIAISLVPPLANAGILLGVGRTDLAMGSLLLFATNYFAILLTGALVFGIMGFPGVALVRQPIVRRRSAMVVAVVMVVVISVPLGVQTLEVWATHSVETAATRATEDWIDGTGYTFVSARSRDGIVDIVIAGSGPVPPADELAAAVRDRVFGMEVRVEAVQTERFQFGTAP